MLGSMDYSVGEVARFANVTVRTLHHYDAVGLLSPSGRSRGGYRRYSDADVQRLTRVLYYRELGFGLEEIASLLASGDPAEHLRSQHRLLRHWRERITDMLTSLEKEMEAMELGVSLTPEERLEIFGENAEKLFGNGAYAVEAQRRWGDTDAWKESNRRTAAYTKDAWLQIKGDADASVAAFAAAMQAGEPVDGSVATALAEAHRAHIDRWFYPCSHDMHVRLGDMYISDERFAETYDQVEPGLSHYVHDAIVANAVNRR